jgi:peptidoglycan/LPS O-acetylase OafA/YrhL
MAWWVVMSHMFGIVGLYDTGNYFLNLPIKLITWSGMPVNIFIIISGFVITHLFLGKRESYSPYILRRFFRIFPIYIFCLFVAISLENLRQFVYTDISFIPDKTSLIASFAAQHENFWPHLLLHLTMLHGLVPDSVLPYSTSIFLGPAWSLSLEWQFYVLAPIIIGLMARGIAPMLCTALVLYLLGVLANSGMMGKWDYPAFLLLSIKYFLIGILSRLMIEKFKQNEKLWELPIVVAITFALANVIESAIWICFFVIALTESKRIANVPNVFQKILNIFVLNNIVGNLGKWSYSTYLIHIPLLMLIIGGLGKTFGTDFISLKVLVSMLLASIPVIIAVSWLLYSTIEVGGINFGKKVSTYVNSTVFRRPSASL